MLSSNLRTFKDDLFFAILTLVTALSISAVAIFYSVSGIMAVFSSTPISAMIMGGIIEISKLSAIVWLHQYWKRVPPFLKFWLIGSICILMAITSGGIFGFLSKAHTDQAAEGNEAKARLEVIVADIGQRNSTIDRLTREINKSESQGSSLDITIQTQIDREQDRIDLAFKRLATAEAGQESKIAPFQTELDRIDASLSALDAAISNKDIRQAQRIVGANPDGSFGPTTAAAIQAFREQSVARRSEIVAKISSIQSKNPATELVKSQIEESNKLINRLREKLGQESSDDLSADIQRIQDSIKAARSELEELNEERIRLERINRTIEAKVGPIKFIAEAIYGESTEDLLEQAVKWFIIMIVIVFDPLAVVLLIASQYTFNWNKESRYSTAIDKDETIDQIDPVPTEAEIETDVRVPGSDSSEIDVDSEIFKEISDNLDDPGFRSYLDANPELREELKEFLDRKTVVKPAEDVRKKGSGWLER
jgi:peptidoglycan hydrolase-like protein with peptidoglycan-binding domain